MDGGQREEGKGDPLPSIQTELELLPWIIRKCIYFDFCSRIFFTLPPPRKVLSFLRILILYCELTGSNRFEKSVTVKYVVSYDDNTVEKKEKKKKRKNSIPAKNFSSGWLYG